MTLALALVMGSYVAFVGALAWRASRSPAPGPTVPEADLPTVAVIVAARDEEAVIERCLDALMAQDYPVDRLEILVADDHSRDRTAALVRRTAAQRVPVPAGDLDEMPVEVPSVRCIPVPDAEGSLRGKANALHAAIQATGAEVLLITDADCAPEPTWVRATAEQFADAEVGIVCGLARIEAGAGRFDRVQALDWTFLLGAVSTLAEAGAPATGMGNNMGLRRAAYEAVGGYPALPFSVTEDFTLVRAVAERTPWRVRFPIRPATTVWTLPTASVAEAYAQRRRWARGGLSGDPWVPPAYAGLFVVHALPLLGLALTPGAAALGIAAKIVVDGILLRTLLRTVGSRLGVGDLLAFEAFLFGYLTTLPAALVLQPSISWKGRRH
ncbi:MAG: glycosyltransferase [Bacteroidota bacterium]